MSKIENPFLVYGYESPEYFCDREQETRALIESLVNGANVTLLSPRRYGKTGLIHNAFYQLRSQHSDIACFYIDIYSTKSLTDFVLLLGKAIIGQLDTPTQRAEGFVQKFFRSAQLTLGIDPMTGLPQVGVGFQPAQTIPTLEEIFAYIAQADRICYIAIDEFQQVRDYPEKNVEELLRTYVQRTQNVHFIFAGSKLHMMDEMFSSPRHPFYRSTDRLPLDILPEDVYYDWAVERLARNNIRMEKTVFHSIYEQVDGVTWYMQAILNHLYRHAGVAIDEELVAATIREIIRSEEDGYKRQYHLLTLLQARLLTAIAKEKIVSTPTAGAFIRDYHLNSVSSVQRALQFLLDEEFIYKSESGYIVYDRFMGMWLRRM